MQIQIVFIRTDIGLKDLFCDRIKMLWNPEYEYGDENGKQ